MKASSQTSPRDSCNAAAKRARAAVRQEWQLLGLPAILSITMGCRLFVAFGDFILSTILGGVAFVTMTPMLSAVTNREHKSRVGGR